MSSPANDPLAQAAEAIEALKRTKPTTEIQARARAAELIRLEKIQLEAARKLADASAAKRIKGGNGHARPARGKQSLTKEELGALAKGLNAWLGPILADIEKRLGELEAQPYLKDAGIWRSERIFKPGDVATHAGAMWVCREMNSNTRPGMGGAWRLMHKTR